MTTAGLALGILRLAAIVLPALIAAHLLSCVPLRATGAVALLAEAVLLLSLLLIGGEALGLVSLMRPAPLAILLVLITVIAGAVVRRRGVPARPLDGLPPHPRPQLSRGGGHGPVRLRDITSLSALVAVVVVAGQWCVGSANSLGGGMLSFDTLWYHMPFAARFAQTGSVTAIQFTQADPYTAYYPANAELIHGLGIAALHGDLLSPFLNLLWLSVGLLAAWCAGRPWMVERQTLVAGCVVLGLPVLSTTQPGQAFNDVAGLAMLLAAVALVANAGGRTLMLASAGLALGFAVGTKVTFIVPALVLLIAVPALAPPRRRVPVLALLCATSALTGGWWYLRDLIAGGNPFGLRLQVGPLVLSGPVSPLASEQQGTVISNLEHLSLWGSRFAPGLHQALGPAWAVVLALFVAGVLGAIACAGERTVRVLALAAAAAGITYFFLPTSASGIARGPSLFEVNLRYATPALAIGMLLVPIVVALRRPGRLYLVAPSLAAVVLVTQFAHSLWPAQPARHGAFVVAVSCMSALGVAVWRVGWRRLGLSRLSARALALGSMTGLIGFGAAAIVVQRHYFHRRYLLPNHADPGLGAIYRWAQPLSHARIALYGALAQYPLYGAEDSNRVDYLGSRTAGGGFAPIASCRAWRDTVNRGRYRYLVLTRAQTADIPVIWTRGDPAATIVAHPGPREFVFRLDGRMHPSQCP